MTKNPLTELQQFTGTEQWFRHGLNRKVLYTDGVQYVAEQAGAYWLVDEIALAQAYIAPVKATPVRRRGLRPSTMPRPGRRSPPSVRCSASSKAAARCRRGASPPAKAAK